MGGRDGDSAWAATELAIWLFAPRGPMAGGRPYGSGRIFRLEDGEDDYSFENKEDLISEELPEQSDEASSNDEKINEKEKEQK